MKHIGIISVISVMALLGSCGSLSFDSRESSSWAAGDTEKAKGNVRVISVTAEKTGEWGALEKEITDLLPLLFSEHGYHTVSPSAHADYLAEVKVREREYQDGWETKRSLSAEVRLWAGEGEGSLDRPLPFAAGRALNHGKQSFASSRTLSAMLRTAVKNAVSGLPPRGENAASAREGR